MTKATITKLWIAGLIVLIAGLLVGGVSLGLMLAYGGTFTPQPYGNGYDFVPTLDGFFWTTVGFMIVGFTIAAVGGVVKLAAWIGALINTYRLQEKTWFVVLLVGGLIGLAFGLVGDAAMIAYMVAGPDEVVAPPPRVAIPSPQPAPQPAPLVHAS